jgi:transketolase
MLDETCTSGSASMPWAPYLTDSVWYWKAILQLHHEPAVLVLSRQAVPKIDRKKYAAASGLTRGAYVLADAPGADPEVILIGTGSEVALCLQAYEKLSKEGVRVRVVSMPSWELFDDQDRSYRESVLPRNVKPRVSVEQASDFGWWKYTGSEGHNIVLKRLELQHHSKTC